MKRLAGRIWIEVVDRLDGARWSTWDCIRTIGRHPLQWIPLAPFAPLFFLVGLLMGVKWTIRFTDAEVDRICDRLDEDESGEFGALPMDQKLKVVRTQGGGR